MPSPSWPLELLPQHWTEPSWRRAQVNLAPAEDRGNTGQSGDCLARYLLTVCRHRAARRSSVPSTTPCDQTGVRTSGSPHLRSQSHCPNPARSSEPAPRSSLRALGKPPKGVDPQQLTDPPARIAHVCQEPALTDVASVRPDTGTGVARLVVEPSPSLPPLFKPQHHTAPLTARAQLCQPPPATSAMFARPGTGVAMSRSVSVPSPRRPKTFEPQHDTVLSTRTAHECHPPLAIMSAS